MTLDQDANADDLLEQWKTSADRQSELALALVRYAQSEGADLATVRRMQEHLHEAHGRSLDLLKAFEPFKVD